MVTRIPPELRPHVDALRAFITPSEAQARIDALTATGRADAITKREGVELLRLLNATEERADAIGKLLTDRFFREMAASQMAYLRAITKAMPGELESAVKKSRKRTSKGSP